GLPGDIFITLPSFSFEDSYLVTTVHCALMVECVPNAQVLALQTENDTFLQIPFIYSIPIAGKFSKREERASVREAYTLPWTPIDLDGAQRIVGREYSIPMERGVAIIRKEFPKVSDITTTLALSDPNDQIAIGRFLESSAVLLGNSLDVIAGLRDLPNRKQMQVDLLMVWPLLVTEKSPLIIRDPSKPPVESERLIWWNLIDSTGFHATSGIVASSATFDAGSGIFLTIIGIDKLNEFVETMDTLFKGLKSRFSKLTLAQLIR
ncbi:MAG: hypothetical protein ABIC40_00215, partial [bacterium]